MNVYCHGQWTPMIIINGWWVCDRCGTRLWEAGKTYEVKA